MIIINITVFLEYLKYQKHYSEYTITNYKTDILKFVDYVNDNKLDYKDIEYQKITDYLTYLKNHNLNPSSISRNLSALRSLYNYYVKNEIVKNNPFKLVSGMKKEKKLPNYLQYNEFEEILNSCKEDDLGIRNRALIELLLASGLRVGEITKVDLNNLDLNNRSIKIIGKGNKERIVYFGEYAKDSLITYLNVSRDNLLNNKKSNILFINHLGNPLTPRGVADIIEKLINKTSIEKKVSPHTFRHSFATMLINEGANSKTVQELLGHASIGTTSIYTHISNNKLRNEYLKAHPRAKRK